MNWTVASSPDARGPREVGHFGKTSSFVLFALLERVYCNARLYLWQKAQLVKNATLKPCAIAYYELTMMAKFGWIFITI